MPTTPIASSSEARVLHLPSQSSQSSAWLTPFEPIGLLRGGHAQTLAGNYWRRKPFLLTSEAVPVEVDPSDGSRILCHCHWQAEAVRTDRLTILLVHGLEGSSDSQYIQGITARAFELGYNVIRMNMRNCGGTDTWTPTLYHSGLSGDIRAALDYCVGHYGLTRVAIAGYSMGGNLVLKLAGDLGEDAPPWLLAAVGVCPAADLAATADALHAPSNRMYERHFLRNLMRRFRRKVTLFPERYSMAGLEPIRSVREFDDRITSPNSGFTGADDYYFRAAAARVVSRIAIPTLVVHALDDPFIRMVASTREALSENPAVTLIETAHGGHCAFLAKTSGPPSSRHNSQPGGFDHNSRHWAEETLVQFLLAHAGHANGS